MFVVFFVVVVELHCLLQLAKCPKALQVLVLAPWSERS